MDNAGEHESKETIDAGKHGSDYELEVAKLFFKRVLDNNYDKFQFTREKKGLGKFDDLTLIYTKAQCTKFRLVQIKHLKNATKKISHSQLTLEDSYFFLPKYFSYYLESWQNIQDDSDFQDAALQDLIICTNIGFETDLKCITLKKLGNDEIFQNSFHLYKLEILEKEKNIIFKDFFISDLRKLAYELLYYVLCDKIINISSLIKDENVSLIKKYYRALVCCVINAETKRFRTEFLKETVSDQDNIASQFRKLFYEAAIKAYQFFKNSTDEDFLNEYKIKSIQDAKNAKDVIRNFKSADSIYAFLKNYKLKMTLKSKDHFKMLEGNSSKTLPGGVREDPEKINEKINSFLEKLVFAVEKINIEDSLRSELGEQGYYDFHKKMYEWYHKGGREVKENTQRVKKRKWITKDNIMNEALEAVVKFNGYDLRLAKLIGKNTQIIDSKILFSVFCSRKIIITLPINDLKNHEYYINRTLNSKVLIKRGVLHKIQRDLFIFSNLKRKDMHTVDKWLPEGECLLSLNPLPTEFSKFVYTNVDFKRNDFSTYVALVKDVYSSYGMANAPLHWLAKQENKLIWKNSYGSVSGLRDHIEDSGGDGECLTEEELQDEALTSLNVIVAEPGMGKSTLFNHIAQELIEKGKNSNEPSWIIKINLKNFIDKIDDATFEDIGVVVQFLSEVGSSDDEILKQILRYQLENEGNVTILFDGLDELSTDNQQCKIIELSKFIIKNLKINKLWLCARPHLKDILEKELDIFALSLKELSKDEQINFLCTFWKPDSSRVEEIKSFAERLLHIFQQNSNLEEQNFLGIPLQIKLLAVAYHDEIVMDTPRIPEKIDLPILFKDFVQAMYNFYFSKYNKELSGRITRHMKVVKKCMIRILDEAHQNVALDHCILLPLYIEKDKFLRENVDFQADDLVAVGLVYKLNKKFHFIHSIFAEYFAAYRFSDMAISPLVNTSAEKQFIAKFLEEFLYRSSYQFIRYFFDYLLPKPALQHSVLKGTRKSVNRASKEEINEKDSVGRTVVYYALAYHRYEILKALFEEKNIQIDIGSNFIRQSIKQLFCKEVMINYGYSQILMDILEKMDTSILLRRKIAMFLNFKECNFALEWKRWDIVQMLLNKGAIINPPKANSYDVPLLFALKLHAPIDVVKTLLDKTDVIFFSSHIFRNGARGVRGIYIIFWHLVEHYGVKDIEEIIEFLKIKEACFNYERKDGYNPFLKMIYENFNKEDSDSSSTFCREHLNEIDRCVFLVRALLENGAMYDREKNVGILLLESFLILESCIHKTSMDRKKILNYLKQKHFDTKKKRGRKQKVFEHLERHLYDDLIKYTVSMEEKFSKSDATVKTINLLVSLHNLFKAIDMDDKENVVNLLQIAEVSGWLKAFLNASDSLGYNASKLSKEKGHFKISLILYEAKHK